MNALRTNTGWILLWVLMSVAVVSPNFVSAQETATEEVAFKDEIAPTESKLTLLQLIRQGGVTMFPLGLLSIAMVTFAVRNFLALNPKKLLPPDIIPVLGRQMADRDVHGALATCESNSCLLTAVVGAGLERVASESEIDMDNIREAVEESSTEQMVSFMAPISYLSIIGAVSPMVGLLGTVSGMIKAFRNISLGGMGKPEVLAGNIGEALVTTATGLIIAIPSMILYFYFKNSFMKSVATSGRINGTLIDAMRTGVAPSSYRQVPAAESAPPPPA